MGNLRADLIHCYLGYQKQPIVTVLGRKCSFSAPNSPLYAYQYAPDCPNVRVLDDLVIHTADFYSS